MLKKDGIYFAYLRKSREDRDAELYGGIEDTLARQEYIIADTIKRYNIQISRWYKEVVSGETISARPEMQRLLSDIETVQPDGVVVMEVERLSRGNPQDQGRVSDTFKYADSLIITPSKIYDLQQENDEEWLDFGLMRSRMEYRTIKRRLQNGRTTSAMQGKFIGNTPPYGWKREKLPREKGYTLVPAPDTAWVLKLIYTLLDTGTDHTGYTPVGTTVTGHILDEMGISPPKGDRWNAGVISRIAKNPANIGLVRINYRQEIKTMQNGEIKRSRPINHDCLHVPARWAPQVDEHQFKRVCERLKQNTVSPVFLTVKNPLAGIIYCSCCGKVLRRRPAGARNKTDTLMCRTYQCPTVGAYYDLVEERLVTFLESTLKHFKLKIDDSAANNWTGLIKIKSSAIKSVEIEIETLKKQLNKVHAYFEKEIYPLETFLERSNCIKEQIQEKEKCLSKFNQELYGLSEQERKKVKFVPYFDKLLNSYKKSDDPIYKNTLLKKIVARADYTKTTKGDRSGTNNDAFELDVHIRFKL